MTVNVTTSKITYTGDGSTTAFAVTFPILDETHLVVQRVLISTEVATTLALTTDYTVSGTGNTSGETDYTTGTVTLLSAPSSLYQVVIKRGIPFKQETDYIENDNFPAETHERALDKLTMIAQQLQTAIDDAELTAGGGGGTVDDGDKGDIIVSSSGATWTIDSDAVTYAKMQDVSTSDVLLGRVSSGSGNVEEVTCTDFAQSLLDDTTASAARSTLGVGSISTQDSSSVTITGGSITGITDLAVADGGTGASTAAGARTSLGLVIGTDVQGYDAQLTDIAGLTPTDNNVIIGNGSNFVVESGATLRTSIGLAIGTDVQAYDAELTAIATLTSAADKIPYFTGSETAALTDFTSTARNLLDDTSTAAMRTTLGLAIGTDVQAYSATLADLTSKYNPTSSAGSSHLDFYEDTDNGTEYVRLTVPSAITTTRTIALPTNTPVNGYSVITDGSGNWSYSNVSGGGGGGTPGGSDTHVQFNDSGNFNGDSGMTYTVGTGIINLSTGITVGGNATASGYINFEEDSDNGTNYVQLTCASSLAANYTVTLPSASVTLASLTGTETLTNKTLTAPIISSISNTGTLTLPTSTDTLVGRDTTDTLTAKTLTAPKIASGGFIADANGNEQVIFTTTASAVNELTVTNAATTTGPIIAATGGDTNIPLNLQGKGTGVPRIRDGADPTKMIALDAVGSSTGATLTLASAVTSNRTVTFPDATVTLASLTGTETLTNKTMTSPTLNSPTLSSAVLGTPSSGNLSNCTSYPSASDTLSGIIEVAVQSEMETGTSTTLAVTPGRQQYHASAAKAWLVLTFSGAAPVNSGSYNITSLTDNSIGNTTITIATDFSSTVYAVCGMTSVDDSSIFHHSHTKAAGTIIVECANTADTHFDGGGDFIFFGDQ